MLNTIQVVLVQGSCWEVLYNKQYITQQLLSKQHKVCWYLFILINPISTILYYLSVALESSLENKKNNSGSI